MARKDRDEIESTGATHFIASSTIRAASSWTSSPTFTLSFQMLAEHGAVTRMPVSSPPPPPPSSLAVKGTIAAASCSHATSRTFGSGMIHSCAMAARASSAFFSKAAAFSIISGVLIILLYSATCERWGSRTCRHPFRWLEPASVDGAPSSGLSKAKGARVEVLWGAHVEDFGGGLRLIEAMGEELELLLKLGLGHLIEANLKHGGWEEGAREERARKRMGKGREGEEEGEEEVSAIARV